MKMNLSYWEIKSFQQFDCIIVGSGIVGLSTAISLKEKSPNMRVLILERGLLPSGASTKNAGFACFGSLSEVLEDFRTMGEEKSLELINMRLEGLKLLRERFGDEVIGYKHYGGYEFVFKHEEKLLEERERLNKLLNEITGKNTYEINPAKYDDFGFHFENMAAFIYNRYEGQIDTGKCLNVMIDRAIKLGVYIINGCEVNEISGGEKLQIRAKSIQSEMLFETHKVLVATNAFSKQLNENLDVKPGRGQVIVTSEIENLKPKGIFHFDQGYFYFRSLGKRILFGGGRNLAFEDENTTIFAENEMITQRLEQYLRENILPQSNFTIDYKWSGIMAFGNEKFPIVHEHNNILYAVRLGGMGMALGSYIGKQNAAILLS